MHRHTHRHLCFFFQGQTWRALVDMFIGHKSHTLRALRIPAEQTNIASKRSPFCIGNIFKTIDVDVQGFVGVFLWSFTLGSVPSTQFQTQNHVEVSVLALSVVFPFPFPKKKQQKTHTKNRQYLETTPQQQVEVGFASTLLGAMVFLMSLTYFTNHSDQDADSGWFWEVPGFENFVKHRQIEAFGMDRYLQNELNKKKDVVSWNW